MYLTIKAQKHVKNPHPNSRDVRSCVRNLTRTKKTRQKKGSPPSRRRTPPPKNNLKTMKKLTNLKAYHHNSNYFRNLINAPANTISDSTASTNVSQLLCFLAD